MKAWKHHIAEHFEEDHSLCSNNGAGNGATVFTDFTMMKLYLEQTGQRWYIAELDIEEHEMIRLDHGMATILLDKDAVSDFKPLEEWEFQCGRSSAE